MSKRDKLLSIQARIDAATAGPWEAHDCGHDCCFWVTDPSDRDGQLAGFKTAADAVLFAHSRTDIQGLLDLARSQAAQIKTLRAGLAKERAAARATGAVG